MPTAVDSEPSARPPADSSASDLDESAPVETTPEPAVESRTASATGDSFFSPSFVDFCNVFPGFSGFVTILPGYFVFHRVFLQLI